MKKALPILATSLAIMLSTTTAQADRFGRSWTGCEYSGCQWNFKWTRIRNTNDFRAEWWHRTLGRVRGTVSVSLSGSSVNVFRPASGGAPACSYSGTYKKRDVHNGIPAKVRGTYSCGGGPAYPWRAEINNY